MTRNIVRAEMARFPESQEIPSMTLEEAMAALLETADLIVVCGKTYLLAPVDPAQIDALAACGADDRESDQDAESHDAAIVENLDRLSAATADRRTHRYGSTAKDPIK